MNREQRLKAAQKRRNERATRVVSKSLFCVARHKKVSMSATEHLIQRMMK